MKQAIVLAVLTTAAVMSGCSTTEGTRADNDPLIQETRVYLETVKPESVSWVRHDLPLRYQAINNMFALLRTDSGVYLLETRRICTPLTSQEYYDDMRDTRTMRGRLRAGVDTIRGCTIEAIYRLPEQAAETTDEETGQNTTQEPD